MKEPRPAAGSGPLRGLRVVEMGSVVMAPYAAQVLAAMGAEVVKIEPPSGDLSRHLGSCKPGADGALFLNCNQGKQSAVIDLKQAEGLALARRLVAGADVFLHNMRLDAVERLGLSYAQLADGNGRLIYCAAYGYGAAGRDRARPAYDDIIQAASGVAALGQRISGAATYAPTIIADKSTALYAVIAILGAVAQRGITGRGQQVEVPMFESMVHFLGVEHLDGLTFQPPNGPSGYARVTSPQRRPYRTADGFLAAMPYTGEQWSALFAWCGDGEFIKDPRFADDQARARHIGILHARLAALMPSHSTDEWVGFLERHDIPFSRINSLDTLVEDPHLNDVGFWQTVDHPVLGSLLATSLPIRYGGPAAPLPAASRAPLLGEHTGQVLAALGLGAGEIEALAARGVVRLGSKRGARDE